MEREDLGFIVAKLGSAQNKETFIANQSDYPDINGWSVDETVVTQQASVALQNVTQGFDGQIKQARIKVEYDALLKETKYNDMLHQESNQINGYKESFIQTPESAECLSKDKREWKGNKFLVSSEMVFSMGMK